MNNNSCSSSGTTNNDLSNTDPLFDTEAQSSILTFAKAATSTLKIRVYHKCFGKCAGNYYPPLLRNEESRVIECVACHSLFSPRRFVGHTHGPRENTVCHWGFDSYRWRHYIRLSNKQPLNNLGDEELMKHFQSLITTGDLIDAQHDNDKQANDYLNPVDDSGYHSYMYQRKRKKTHKNHVSYQDLRSTNSQHSYDQSNNRNQVAGNQLPIHVTIEEISIGAYSDIGEPYLCLPQLLHHLREKFTLQTIIDKFEESLIEFTYANPYQVEGFKKASILPPDAISCPLIKRSDVDRVCLALYEQCSSDSTYKSNSTHEGSKLYHVPKPAEGYRFGETAGSLMFPKLLDNANNHMIDNVDSSNDLSKLICYNSASLNNVTNIPASHLYKSQCNSIYDFILHTTQEYCNEGFGDLRKDILFEPNKYLSGLGINDKQTQLGSAHKDTLVPYDLSLCDKYRSDDTINRKISKVETVPRRSIIVVNNNSNSSSSCTINNDLSNTDPLFVTEAQNSILTFAKAATSTLKIRVYHKCFGKCAGNYYPSLLKNSESRIIECVACHSMFSPRRFIGHTHGPKENTVCHWGFNSYQWRYYIHLSKKQPLNNLGEEELMKNFQLLITIEESIDAQHNNDKQANDYLNPVNDCGYHPYIYQRKRQKLHKNHVSYQDMRSTNSQYNYDQSQAAGTKSNLLPINVTIEEISIGAYSDIGEPYLCLPQLLHHLREKFTLQKIIDEFEESLIEFTYAAPYQVEGFKKVSILPPNAVSCPLIKRSDVDRVCLALYEQCSSDSTYKSNSTHEGSKLYHVPKPAEGYRVGTGGTFMPPKLLNKANNQMIDCVNSNNSSKLIYYGNASLNNVTNIPANHLYKSQCNSINDFILHSTQEPTR